MSRPNDALTESFAARHSLSDDEVHVWLAAVDAPETVERAAEHLLLLDDDERARHAGFTHEASQRQFLVAHALKRLTLSRYVDRAPRDWRFVIGSHGKPEIADQPDGPPLRFNLSHTRGLAVCAVTWGRDLGVDVENATRRWSGLGLARRYFAEAEVDDLAEWPEPEQPAGFLCYWTLKEAYIKARGLGLAIPLAEFAFQLQLSLPPRIEFSPQIRDDASQWRFMQTGLEPCYALAVGVREPTDRCLRALVYEVAPPASAARTRGVFSF